MSSGIALARERIQAQGFCGLDDAVYSQINYPLRLSPAICMVWAAVGTSLASATILGFLIPFALLGAILPRHPFDVIYNHGFRYLLGTPELPRYPVRRRLACVYPATLMLSIAALGFHAGMPMVGYIAGSLIVAAAFVNVSTGFCVPKSVIFICGVVFGGGVSS